MKKPKALAAFAGLAIALALTSAASAQASASSSSKKATSGDDGYRLFLKVSNDIANTTVPGYPQVTIGVRGTTFKQNWYCWRDSVPGYTLGDNAPIAPGASGVISSDVDLRGNGNCGADFNGWRDVQLMIKESPDADWVVPEGQQNFRLAFGNETDPSIGRQSGNDRCDPSASGGGNCFAVTGLPNTWWTRPGAAGLFCMVPGGFDQQGDTDRTRRSVMKISVRDDAACNVPRPSRYFPRMSGTPSTSGWPRFGPVSTGPSSARNLATTGQRADQASPVTPDPSPGNRTDLTPNVQAVLSASSILCSWGIRDPKQVPDVCKNAGTEGPYDLGGLTIPAAMPPDGRPPSFKILGVPNASLDPASFVCTDSITIQGSKDGTVQCGQQASLGATESSKDSVSRRVGTKASYGLEWKYGYAQAVTGWQFTNKVSWEASFDQQWGFEKQYTRNTQQTINVSVSAGAAAGQTTRLRVMSTNASYLFNYTADLMFGVSGKAEPVTDPAAPALGMSASTGQQCLASTIGSEQVTGSMRWIAKQTIDDGSGKGGTSAEQQTVSDILDNFNVAETPGAPPRKCPGFPAGFASHAAIQGDGVGSFTSNGEVTTPILDSDGKQAYTADGIPRVLRSSGIGLTACVYVDPPPRASQSNARANQSGGPCVQNVPADGRVDPPSAGTLVQGSARNDALTATHRPDLIVPGAGNDTVVGGGGALDIVDPSPGNDTISGGAGPDDISGGTGNDTIDAGPGPFEIRGDQGNDRITQTGGEGGIWGGTGSDTITTSGVKGSVEGDSGPDTLRVRGDVRGAVFAGGTGSDRYVIGPGKGCAGIFEAPGEGTDRVETARCIRGAQNVEQIALTGSSPLAITTGDGSQTITGNAAGNVIDGGAGSDVMNGGAGSDTVHLGSDAYDTATGGPGADRFVPGGTPSTGYGTQLAPHAQSHRITDFSAAEGDRIVLTAAAFGREVRALRHHFAVVSAPNPVATSSRPTLLHDPRTGLLAFDRDGSGLRSPRVVAMVPVGTPITPGTFEIR